MFRVRLAFPFRLRQPVLVISSSRSLLEERGGLSAFAGVSVAAKRSVVETF